MFRIAGVGQELASIHRKRGQMKGSALIHGKGAMLPLHDAFGTGRILGFSNIRRFSSYRCSQGLTIGNGTIVSRLIVTIIGKRVRDSGQVGFQEFIVDRVIKSLLHPWYTLERRQSCDRCLSISHTGPVITLRDLVVQVPTRLAILFAPTVVRNSATERYPTNIFDDVLGRREGTRQIVESDAVGRRTREHRQRRRGMKGTQSLSQGATHHVLPAYLDTIYGE